MSKFKVGDRVVGYDTTGANRGFIRSYNKKDNTYYLIHDGGFDDYFHEKQLRKLVKKKDKEINKERYNYLQAYKNCSNDLLRNINSQDVNLEWLAKTIAAAIRADIV